MKPVWLVYLAGLGLPAVMVSASDPPTDSPATPEPLDDAFLISWLHSIGTPDTTLKLIEECSASIANTETGNVISSPNAAPKSPTSPKLLKPSHLSQALLPDPESSASSQPAPVSEVPSSSPLSPTRLGLFRQRRKIRDRLKKIQDDCILIRGLSRPEKKTLTNLIDTVGTYGSSHSSTGAKSRKSSPSGVKNKKNIGIQQSGIESYASESFLKILLDCAEHNTTPEDMTQSDQRAFYETYDKHHQAELINRLMKKVRRHYDLASIERLKEASYSPIFARYGEKWSQLAHLCLATSPSATMVVPWVTKGLEKFQIPIPVTKDTRPVQVAQLWYPIINDLLSTLVINNQVEAAAMLAKWIQAQLEPKTTSALSLEDSQKTVSPPDVPEKYQWLLSPPLPQNQQSSDPPSSEQEVSSAQPPSPLLPALEIPPAKSTIQSRKRSGSIRSQDKDSNPVAKSKSPPSRYPYKPIHRNEQHILLELLFKRAVWAYKLRRREMQTALLEGLSCLHLQDSAFRSECDTLQTTGVLDSVQQISLETSHDDDAGSSSSSSDASTIQNTLAATDDLEVVPQHPDKYDFPSNYQILLSGARVMQISKPMGLNKPKYDQPKTGEFRRVTDQSESENDESLASESSDSDSDAD